jgi:hypothetical protein
VDSGVTIYPVSDHFAECGAAGLFGGLDVNELVQ